jgi:DNA-binding CsgD family transcriptional regulator
MSEDPVAAANQSTGTQNVPARLTGRSVECAAVDRLLRSVCSGESRALVVHGDPGIGKTALLEYLAWTAAACRVLRAGGVQSEMEIAFAGLHQICSPMLGRLEAIPEPQRDALRITFGMISGPMPDPFLVGLGVLSLLSEAAAEQPVLCIVDDEQWLDRASARILAFVARRLGEESVGLVIGARDPSTEFTGLPALIVGGLPEGDARLLLESVLTTAVDSAVRDRIVAEAGGNPLALLEFPRDLTAAELAGGFALPQAKTLSQSIEERFLRRTDALPAATKRLLLLASAEPVGDPRLVRQAAARLGIDFSAARPAGEAGLVEFSDRIRFRHPLVRSAIYWSFPEADRREVHRALAEVTDPSLDPDRRAWHLAQAVDGPDEDVADELERSAGRAQARGGFAAAAAFLERATALTRDPVLRVRRALDGAQANVQAGAIDSAQGLLEVGAAGPLSELAFARVALVRAQIAFVNNRGNDAAPLLVEAAGKFESVDQDLARSTYLDALVAAQFAGRFAAAGGTLLDVARAASDVSSRRGAPAEADLLLDGLADMFTRGYASAFPILRRAVKAMRPMPLAQELRWLSMGYAAALTMWDHATTKAMSARWMQLARDAGALSEMPLALMSRTYVLIAEGDLTAASLAVEEMTAAIAATESAFLPYGAIGVAACRGDEIDLLPMIEMTIEKAGQRGEGFGISAAHWAKAVLHNGHGRYGEALAAAKVASEVSYELGLSTWALIELIEAAAHLGDADAASRAFDELKEMTHASASDWGLGVQSRMNALLSDGDIADRIYQESIARLSDTPMRFELARARLYYGEWLRRNRRRGDALKQLRIGCSSFDEMGMAAFAERTRRQLRAAGDTARVRSQEAPVRLTEQERQIARLAREGLTNPEIGTRLFISARTVQYHLKKVFAKLDISSRAQIGGVLD